MFYRVKFDYDEEAGHGKDAEVTWFNAVYCKDLYFQNETMRDTHGYELDEFYEFEFVKPERQFICPNTSTIELQNDPDSFE